MIGFLCLKNSIIRESLIKCGKNLTLWRYGTCLCGELAPLDMWDLKVEAALIVKSCLPARDCRVLPRCQSWKSLQS